MTKKSRPMKFKEGEREREREIEEINSIIPHDAE